MLEWAPDGSRERRHLDIAGSVGGVGGVRVRFEDPEEAPAVVVASQWMDDNPGRRSLDPDELLHVDEKLNVTSTIAVDGPPAQPLTRTDLGPRAAASQSEEEDPRPPTKALGTAPAGPSAELRRETDRKMAVGSRLI